jgi:hypothetical protein
MSRGSGLAGNGPLLTPLSPFTDGKVPKHVWTVPGVVKKNNFSTDFSCTNLDGAGKAADIGVEIFDNAGNQLNSVGTPLGSCTAGALLAVQPGSSVTIGLTGTAQLHEDCVLGLGTIETGVARIVSTSSKITCSAVIVDTKHQVVDPAVCASCPPPTMQVLKVIKRNKQSGD